MRYNKIQGAYDVHCNFSEQDMAMIERLRLARSKRREEQKLIKVIRDALDFYYRAVFPESDERPTTLPQQ
ncbi:hypothetical protein ANRL4_01199 [Anaerolineae bacterium]|nr:hypothetical protein ANRL4_01199 [Anaerolineae bacterium]